MARTASQADTTGGRRIAAGLLAGMAALAINTVVPGIAELVAVATAHGGVPRLVDQPADHAGAA